MAVPNILAEMPAYTISKVTRANELPSFDRIVRIPVRTREAAEIYLKHDVAIFRKEIEGRSFCYIEVSIDELARVARKG